MRATMRGLMANRYSLLPACTAKVSAFMSRLGARAPRTRYLGRTITAATDGQVQSGVVRTLCSFLTESGAERELEIPVLVHEGEILEPALAMVHGTPVILTAELIDGISKAGSVYDKPHLGTMYSTGYDPELYREAREQVQYQPRIFRPMF